MAVSVGEIEATLVLKDKLTAALNAAVGQIEKAGVTVAGLSGKLGLIGTALTAGVTVPMLAVAKTATDMATDFESALTKIETLTENSRAQVDEWRKDLQSLGPELAASPKELADGMLAVTSAGLSGAAALETLKDAAKASAIGLGDITTIGRTVTAIMQAYGRENVSAAQATATLIATVKEGNVEAASLAGTVGRVVGIAAEMGVSFQQVGGFIATFTRLGVGADEAVTALRGTMNAILRPSKEAEETLAAAGMSMATIRQEIKDKGLTAALIDLVEKFRGNEDALADIIPNVRALAGVLGTAGAQAKDFAEIQGRVNAMFDDARNVIDERFARVMETVAGKWDRLRATLDSVWTTIGTNLLPAISLLLDAMQPLADAALAMATAFDRLPGPIKMVGGLFAILAAVAGPVMVAAWGLITAFQALGAMLPTVFGTTAGGLVTGWGAQVIAVLAPLVAQILPALTALVQGVAAAFAAIVSPAGAAVAAIAAITAAAVYFSGAWDAIVNGLSATIGLASDLGTVLTFLGKAVWDDVVSAFRALSEWAGSRLSAAWASTKDGLSTLGEQFKALAGTIRGDVADALERLGMWLRERLPESIRELEARLVALREKLGEAFSGAASQIAEAAAAIRESANMASRATPIVSAYLDELRKGFAGDAPKAPLAFADALAVLNRELGSAKLAIVADTLKEARQQLDALPAGKARELAEALRSNAFSAKDLAAAFGVSEAAIKLFEQRMEGAKKAAKDAADATERWLRLVQIPQLPLEKAVEQLNGSWLILNDRMIEAERTATIAAFGFRGTQDALETLGERVIPATEARIRSLAETFQEVGPQVDGAFAKVKSFGDFLREDFGKVLIGAFQGGGNIGKSLGAGIGNQLGTSILGAGPGSLANLLTKKLGSKIGGLVGSVIPGVGSILGAIGGDLVGGLFGKLFGNPEKQINPIRQAFVDAAGGLERLGEKAQKAGTNLRALLGAKNAKQYEKAAKDLTLALDRQAFIDAAGGIGVLEERARAAGTTLREMLDARDPDQYRAAIDRLNQALQFQDESMQFLQETVKKYGFTLQELGPAFARQKLDKQAMQLFKEFSALTAAGVDADVVLKRMGGSIGQFVKQALATGTEVPSAMEPMLRRMAELGMLTDASGKKVGSLEEAGIKFSMTMSEGFKSLIEEVKKLTDAIARGLGLAINNIPAINVPVVVEQPQMPTLTPDMVQFPSEVMTPTIPTLSVPTITLPVDVEMPKIPVPQIPELFVPIDVEMPVVPMPKIPDITIPVDVDVPKIPPIDIPVRVQMPNLSRYKLDGPYPMATGGAGRVTRPTLFLAGESGPENFAFGGAGRSLLPLPPGGLPSRQGPMQTDISPRNRQKGDRIDIVKRNPQHPWISLDARNSFFDRTSAKAMARMVANELASGGPSQTRFRGAIRVRR